MTTVFVDTVALIALWEVRDQWHDDAARVMGKLVASRSVLVTTPLILIEYGNAAARKPYRVDVDDLRRIMALEGRLIAPTVREIEQAWLTYRSGTAIKAGIVDHVSFIVMRRLGIGDVFTNDRHFRAAGFNTLF